MLRFEFVPEESSIQTDKVCAKIIYIDDNGQIWDTIPSFNLRTYKELSKSDTAESKQVFQILNQFMLTFTTAEHKSLYRYYGKAYELVESIAVLGMDVFLAQLTDMTTQLFSELDLAHRAIRYVYDVPLPIPSQENKQMRSHDTAAMTFSEDQCRELTAMSIVIKLMCPIWGLMIHHLKPSNVDVNTLDKEWYCYTLLIPTLENSAFTPIYNKLQYYINITNSNAVKELNKTFGSRNNTPVAFVLAKNGYTMARLQEILSAIILVKKFVIYNVWRSSQGDDKPDIMKYVHDATGKTTGARIRGLYTKTKVMHRIDRSDNIAAGSSDNTTHMENASRTSKATADVPIITRIGAMYEAGRMIKTFGFDEALFTRVYEYYLDTATAPSALNRSMIASCFGAAIGGTSLIQYLYAKQYVALLTALQFWLIAQVKQSGQLIHSPQDVGYYQLAHLLTARSTRNTMSTNASGGWIRANYNSTAGYKVCVRAFPGVVEKPASPYAFRDYSKRSSSVDSTRIRIEEQLKTLMDWVVDNRHEYNTAPDIWALMGVDDIPVSGTEIVFSNNIMDSVYAFFVTIHQPQTQPA